MARTVAVALVGTWILMAFGGSAFPAQERVVPSEICRGLWIVPLSFGEETLRLVLDTGAEPTSVDPAALGRVLGHDVRPGKVYSLAGGRLGSLEVGRLRVGAFEMDHLSWALGREIDGVLGFRAFHSVLLTLDYPAGEVRVGHGGLPPPDGRTIFRDVGDSRPMLRIRVDGRREKVLIDSGSTGSFDLQPGRHLDWEVEPRAVGAAARFDRIEVAEAGRLADSLEFGPRVFEQPIVEPARGVSLAGHEVLRHFVWTFDKRARRIRIRSPARDPIRMDSRRGLGIAFRPRARGFEVIRVLAGTPAEALGLETGDLVTHQDGRPITERGCVRPGDDPERESVRLTVRHRETTRQIDLPIATLVP